MKHTCPAHVNPLFCTTVVTARYLTFTLLGIIAPTIEITACTVFVPEGLSR
jgi:hypothetical protein